MKNNAISSIIRIGASSIATIILVPFMIKNIGMEKYSYVSITTFIVSFASFFDLGLSKSLVYQVNSPDINTQERNGVVTFQKIINRIICLLIALFGILAVSFKWEILGHSLSNEDPLYYITTASSIVLLILALYNQYQSSLLEAYFHLNIVNNGTTIKIMTMNIFYLIILITSNSVELYILATVLASIGCTIYYSYYIKSRIKTLWQVPDKKLALKCFQECWNYFRLGICTSLFSALPRLAVIYLSTSIVSVGILDVITKITMSVVNLFASITKPLFALSRSDTSKVASHLKKLSYINSIASLGFFFIILIFRTWISSYFFHDPIVDSNYIQNNLVIFSVSTAIFTCGQPLSMFLMGLGKTNLLTLLLLTNILLFFIIYCTLNVIFSVDILYSLGYSNICVAVMYFANLVRTTSKLINQTK